MGASSDNRTPLKSLAIFTLLMAFLPSLAVFPQSDAVPGIVSAGDVRPPAEGLVYALLLMALGLIVTAVMLARARRRLRDSSERERFQGSLLNVLLHDILSPLLVIRYALDAAGRAATVQVKAQLDKMSLALNQIYEAISRVRDLRGVALGKVRLGMSPVPINDIVRRSIAVFEPLFAENGIAPVLHLGDEDLVVKVDRALFESKVVGNVLANAIKFSERGSQIVVRSRPEGDQVALEVEDQGVGMSAAMVAALFGKSADLAKIGARGEAGTGIGLLQVQAYMRVFGGRVEVHSRPKADYPTGHGTTVCLYLPKPGR